MYCIFINYIIIPPLPVGEAGYSIELLYVYVRVYACNNFAVLRWDPCCSSTLVIYRWHSL